MVPPMERQQQKSRSKAQAMPAARRKGVLYEKIIGSDLLAGGARLRHCDVFGMQ